MTKIIPLSIPDKYIRGIEKIYSTLEKNGNECFMVGGAVRDLIMGSPAEDYDFATNARPDVLMKIFRHAVPTGIKHGTVSVIVDGEVFEVTHTEMTESMMTEDIRTRLFFLIRLK